VSGGHAAGNAWSNPTQAGAEDAARMARFLEERSSRPDQVEVNAAVIRALNPQPGERLLEAGSGTGVLCRLAAGAVAPRGCIVGVDVSIDFVRAAQVATQAPAIDYVNGRAEALPFPNASFDGAWSARTLLHVPDPLAVLRELRRVVRPGGRVALADWDFDTLAVDHPDRELTRRLLHWRSDHHGGNNWSGRQLFRYAVEAGWREVTVAPRVTVACDESRALTQSLWRAAAVARDGGAITAQEHDAWVGVLQERLADGRFFAAITYFIVKGQR
jgi:ubiquinone/menaquinone biosynthesis C-methylase UbiE